MTRPIVLNVGGTEFTTARETLHGSEYFEALLSGRFAEGDGGVPGAEPIFIDRDPALFAHILFFLRTNRLSGTVRSKGLLHDLVEEAHFFMLGDFIELIEERLQELEPPVAAPAAPRGEPFYDGFYRNAETGVCIAFREPKRRPEAEAESVLENPEQAAAAPQNFEDVRKAQNIVVAWGERGPESITALSLSRGLSELWASSEDTANSYAEWFATNIRRGHVWSDDGRLMLAVSLPKAVVGRKESSQAIFGTGNGDAAQRAFVGRRAMGVFAPGFRTLLVNGLGPANAFYQFDFQKIA